MSLMQDLYDSDIPVHLASRRPDGWRVRIGDLKSGNSAEAYVHSWQELELWLTREAIARFPNSEFAAVYRTKSWRPRPYLRLVHGAAAH